MLQVTFPLSSALCDHDAQCLILDKYVVTVNKTNNKLSNKFKLRLITCETILIFLDSYIMKHGKKFIIILVLTVILINFYQHF
jgi:hypothetical protein